MQVQDKLYSEVETDRCNKLYFNSRLLGIGAKFHFIIEDFKTNCNLAEMLEIFVNSEL